MTEISHRRASVGVAPRYWGYAGLVSVLTLLVVAGGTQARADATYVGQSAQVVAKTIKCIDFRQTGGGRFHLDAGVCFLQGKRVNLITFRSSSQQKQWNAVAVSSLPLGHSWANGRGAVVTAKNGNRAAAEIGARVLPGEVRRAGW